MNPGKIATMICTLFCICLFVSGGLHAQEAILHAMAAGDTERVQALLESGADIDALLGVDRSPALTSAVSLESVAMLQLLINAGANLDIQDKFGRTAVMKAISLDCKYWNRSDSYRNMIQLLTNAKASLDIQNRFGQTALMEAIECFDLSNLGLVSLVELLVDAGSDLTIKNPSGDTALTIAMELEGRARTDSVRAEYHRVVQFLREAGATE